MNAPQVFNNDSSIGKRVHHGIMPPRKRKSSIKRWEVDLTFPEPRVESLLTIASYDKISVDEFLTKEIISQIDSLIESDYYLEYTTTEKLRQIWKTGKSVKQKSLHNNDLVRYRTTLTVTSGQIYIIHRLAAFNDKSVEQYLSELVTISVPSLLEALVSRKLIPHEEGLRLYKLWGGTDSSYYNNR